MLKLKLLFGLTLVAVAVVCIWPPFKISQWGMAIIRSQRDLLDPDAKDGFDGLVKSVLAGIRKPS